MNIFTISKLVRGLLLAALVSLMLVPGPASAQFYDDIGDDDEYFEQEEEFMESYDDDFQTPSTPGGSTQSSSGPKEDYSEGNMYQEETVAPTATGKKGDAVTPMSRKMEMTIAEDIDELPFNIAWGAGTGLMIGAWFAIVNEGDNRDTLRTIGSGTVLGIMVGGFIGSRSMIIPTLPRAVSFNEGSTSPVFTPVVSLGPLGRMAGFRLSF